MALNAWAVAPAPESAGTEQVASKDPIFEHLVRFQAKTGVPISIEFAPPAEHIQVPLLSDRGEPRLDGNGATLLVVPTVHHPILEPSGSSVESVESAMRTVLASRPSWEGWDGCTQYEVSRSPSGLHVQPTFAVSKAGECVPWISPLDHRFGEGRTGTLSGPDVSAVLHPIGLGFASGSPPLPLPEDGRGTTVREWLDAMHRRNAQATWRLGCSELGRHTLIIDRVGGQAAHLDPQDYPFHLEHDDERQRARLGKSKEEIEEEHAARAAEVRDAIETMRSQGLTSLEPEVSIPEEE